MTKFNPELGRIGSHDFAYGISEIVVTAHTMGVAL
jgi:hypothetical protein